MRKSYLYTILFLSVLLASCISNTKKNTVELIQVEELDNYIGDNKITNDNGNIHVLISGSDLITNLRKTGSEYFSYQIFASFSSLIVYDAMSDENINNIKIEIVDNNTVITHNYTASEITEILKKINTIDAFSNAIIKDDRNIAKESFSDTIRSLPDAKIDKYLFDHYFKMGPIKGYKIVGFKKLNEEEVAIGVDYYLEDGRRQTYIFLFYFHGNDKINQIYIPPAFLEYFS